MELTVFVIVVFLRFVIPLAIPKYPLPAVLAALVIDAADQTIFQTFIDSPLEGYQTYDKALDVYYLSIAYFSTMRNWRMPAAFVVARFLFIYRLFGTTMFELFDQRWMLLVFANTFEYFFIAYEAIRTRWNPTRLSATAVVALAAFIWIFIKLPQETWIHIAKLDFTDFMSNHPSMWGVFLAVAVLALGAGWQFRSRFPKPDWPFTMSVDDHLPPLDVTVRSSESFFSQILWEKVVILAMISVIFAQILPTLKAGNLATAIGVSILVVANAGISQKLRPLGTAWQSASSQFVAMLAVNTALVFVDSIFLSNTESNLPGLNTLFFVLLLSLLIALYDRYRLTRQTLFDAPSLGASLRAERGVV